MAGPSARGRYNFIVGFPTPPPGTPVQAASANSFGLLRLGRRKNDGGGEGEDSSGERPKLCNCTNFSRPQLGGFGRGARSVVQTGPAGFDVFVPLAPVAPGLHHHGPGCVGYRYISRFQHEIQNLKKVDPGFSFRHFFPTVIADTDVDPLSDVKLICEDKVFRCHKILLSEKSDTFRCMFLNSSFAENKSSEVHIEEISAEIMEEVLKFLYCGYVDLDLDEASSDVEHELLYAAHKYQIQGLVKLVLLAVRDKINAENVCRYLLVADRYNLQELKSSCFKILFLESNKATVVTTPEWAEVSKRHDLVTEMYLYNPRPTSGGASNGGGGGGRSRFVGPKRQLELLSSADISWE